MPVPLAKGCVLLLRVGCSLSGPPGAAVVGAADYRGNEPSDAANDKEGERQVMDDGRPFQGQARIHEQRERPDRPKQQDGAAQAEGLPGRADQQPDADPTDEGDGPGLLHENGEGRVDPPEQMRAEQIVPEIGQLAEKIGRSQ